MQIGVGTIGRSSMLADEGTTDRSSMVPTVTSPNRTMTVLPPATSVETSVRDLL
jgi:hypothetical protein